MSCVAGRRGQSARGHRPDARLDRGAWRSVSADTIRSYQRIYNYSADAGQGSATFKGLSSEAEWRRALLTTVAAGALWVASSRWASAGPDACSTNGVDTATCQGNQHNGIASGSDFPASYTTLNVNTLNQDIAPTAPGTAGINFQGTTTVAITSDTGTHKIDTTVSGGDGIYATGPFGVTINHTGDILSGGRGIFASSNYGSASVISSGTINSSNDGIRAFGYAGVTVNHTGDITSTNQDGIYVSTFIGSATVGGTGKINANFDGIFAFGYTGVTVNHTGDITSTNGRGIYAFSQNQYGANVTVTSTGKVSGYSNGIEAVSSASSVFGVSATSGSVSVTSTGDVSASSFFGIGIKAYSRAYSPFAFGSPYSTTSGSVSVTSIGDVSGGRFGIEGG